MTGAGGTDAFVFARNARAEVDAVVTGCADGPTSDKGYGLKKMYCKLQIP